MNSTVAKKFPFHSTNHCPSCRQGLSSLMEKKELKVSTDHSKQAGVAHSISTDKLEARKIFVLF
jgi:hypothetical protein